MPELYIVQVMAKKKFIHPTLHGHLYGQERIKIHPVEAESGQEAMTKIEKYYKENKPDWKMYVVDTEVLVK